MVDMTFNLIDDPIEDVYKAILKKITDGKVFGERIDLENPKHVAVAGYLAGVTEGRKDASELFNFIEYDFKNRP